VTSLQLAYDSVTPGTIPEAADFVFPWFDGLFAWPAAQYARFAGRRRNPVTIEGNPRVGVFDLEPGCCTVGEVARGMHARRLLGLSSVVYCSEASWPSYLEQLTEALAATATPGAPSYWWVAAYEDGFSTDVDLVRPPSALPCLGRRLQAVACQYASPTSGAAHYYDLSVVDLARWPLPSA